MSAIQAIVLACTAQRPSYGYEIIGRVKREAADSLGASGSGACVYRALRRLHERGYVAPLATPAAQQQQPIGGRHLESRRWYRATPAGLRAWSTWVGRLQRSTVAMDIQARVETAARQGALALCMALDDCEGICTEREELTSTLLTLAADTPSLRPLCDLEAMVRRRAELAALRQRIRLARSHIGTHARMLERACRPNAGSR